jgi:hypothetical protein
LLSKAEYSDSEVVQGTLTTVKGLTGALPVAVMKLEYGQTPASVADIASYTRDKADAIRLVKTLIPLTLAISGVIFLLGAAAVATASRSRTRAKVAA